MSEQCDEPAEGDNAGAGVRTLRLALAEMAGSLGNVSANMAMACALATQAAREGAQLILFPEGCLTGNALENAADQAFLEADVHAFAPLSDIAINHRITICVGFVSPFDGGFNSGHAILEPDRGFHIQRKCFRAKTEPPFMCPWSNPERVVFEVGGIRLVVVICSEISAPNVKKAIAKAKPEVLLHPSAGSVSADSLLRGGEGVQAKEVAQEFEAACRRVVEQAARKSRATGMPKAGANPLGFDGKSWWPGNSYAVNAQGEVVLWLPGENRPERMGKPRLAVGNLPV